MQEDRESYDQSITIFSPDGRMFQVEYAREAVKKGSPSLGLVYKDGVIMLVEKRLPSKLTIPESVEKIFKIDKNIACSTSGLVADARILADYSREEMAAYMMRYNENMPVVELVKRISNLKRIYTQYGGIRPFVVAMLIGGIDEEGIHLYETDPSGAYKKYSAGAIGEQKIQILEIFEKEYKDDMSFDQAISLAFKALSKAFKKSIKKFNLEIITITKKELFNKLTEQETNNLKKKF